MNRTQIAVSALVLGTACGFGTIIDTGDGGGCPTVCPDGFVCLDGSCVDPALGCDDVICDTGYTCQNGECVDGQVDYDGDGARAEDDCNDLDPAIFPGAEEVCDGEDQDCDGDVDEGFDVDLDGYTICGANEPDLVDCNDDDENISPGAEERCNGIDDDCDGDTDEEIPARSCSTACGEGEETCLDGMWSCDALEHCDCVPPAEDTRLCGRCGVERRSCQGDMTWGEWGGCEDEGECNSDDTRTEECGSCGSRSQVCGDDCRWGDWTSCSGERDCAPGAVDYSFCDDCTQRTCDDFCRWGPCDVRPGLECQWRLGTNWRCCGGGGRWQWCLSSCMWSTECVDCGGCC